MSATHLFQTLYQGDQLFRLAGESWAAAPVADEPVVDVAILPEAPADDFLAALDQIAASPAPVTAETLPVDGDKVPTVPLVEPVVAAPDPEPRVVIAQPELIPRPAPRPTMPSVLPPVQQRPRRPQLNHKVLLLADEELDPSNLLFLEKILKAVNLNVDGVDLLNLHGAGDLNFGELLRGKYINHFITFGVPFERINLDILMDRYAPVRFDGITFLMADSLPTIEADQTLKKRLWAALQRVFLRS